jgi:1-acyl-sn-glycerol-3-phosphate acyltransferase
MKLYYDMWHGILRVAAPLLTRIRVEGAQNIPQAGALILVSNHISLADPPVLVAYVKRHIHFMLKTELLQQVPLKYLLPPAKPISVRRGKVDREALRAAEAVLKEGGVLGVYPEGTRSHQGGAQEARAGVIFLAQRTGAPILPVAISGTEGIFSQHFPWYRRARVQLTFGVPFTLADLATEGDTNRDALAHAMMGRVAALLPPQYRGVFAQPVPPAQPEQAPAPDMPGIPAELSNPHE